MVQYIVEIEKPEILFNFWLGWKKKNKESFFFYKTKES